MGGFGFVSGTAAPISTGGARLFRRRHWMLASLGLAAGGFWLIPWLNVQGGGAMFVLALALAVLVTGFGMLLLAYHRAVSGLHVAVQAARDGHLSPLPLGGLPRHLIQPLADDYNALARDLGSLFSEMERAQLATIAERNGHEAILQSLPGALLTVDQDHRITGSNLQAETLLGQGAGALLGRDVLEALQADEAGQILLREAFARTEPVRNGLLAIHHDSDQRHLSLNLTFFKQRPDATASCAAIILQDLTDYKRLEEVTHQTEKLVAMGQLAGGVAHELNTPLGTIMGYAQLLKEGRASEERRVEYASVIHDESKRCSRIIDNLLAYARQPACQALQCDVATLVSEAREAVSNCQGRRLQVPIEVPPMAPLVVRGSAGQLEIVLVNLLVNAVQAAAGTPAPRVWVSCAREGSFVTVSVFDSGPGVPPENRRRVFEPFFTTKAAGHGTGLGLAISHSITTRMGGTLRCEVGPQGGACFVLTLPLAD